MRRTPDQPCLNCGDTTHGNYCPQCGQAKRVVAVSVHALVMDVLEDQLVLSRALPRTFVALIGRPGFLTREYVEGRIVRYIAPFRLYLVASVVFFLLLSFYGLRALERVNIGDDEGAAEMSAEDVAEARAAMANIDTATLPPAARRAMAEAQAAVTAAAAAESVQVDLPDVSRVVTGELQPWARNMEINSGNAGRDSVFRARIIDRYGYLPIERAIREFVPEYIAFLPQLVFVLLPIFALMLKLLYIRRRRYYAEHFVFSLHVHAFVFLMFILMLLIRHWIVFGILSLWIVLYIWLAMKRVYAQGWFRTTVKYWTLGFAYFMLLSVGLALTVFVTLVWG
jgi:hypothetical protein